MQSDNPGRRPLQLGLSFDGADTVAALRVIAEVADAEGAANLWIASHLFHREPIACAAAALGVTRNIGVVLLAISPYMVHPVHAVMAAATLDEMFPGRIQLCFGSGAPRDLESVGVIPDQPLQVLRETLDVSRRLLAGETVTFSGNRYRIAGRRLTGGAHRVPLWLAASGPKMLELAGESADGVIISAGTSPAFIGWSLDHVRRGEARNNRSIRKAALVFCSVDSDERTAFDPVRRGLAFVLRGAHHARNLELAGTKLDQAALARAFAAEDWDAVYALMTDDVVRRHAAGGTPSQALAALSAYRTAGLDEIVAYGIQQREPLERLLAVIKPRIAERAG